MRRQTNTEIAKNSLFAIANPWAHYQPGRGTEVTAGYWHAIDGTPVADTWLYQNTVSDRPTVIASDADFGGLPSMDFSSDSYMRSDVYGSAHTGAKSILIVAKSPGDGYLWQLQNGVGGDGFEIYIESGVVKMACVVSGTPTVVSSGVNVGTSKFVVLARCDGASSAIHVNAKTASATGDLGTNPNWTWQSVGRQQGVGNYSNAKYAAGMIFKRNTSTAESKLIMAIAGLKFGITIGS